MTNAHGPDVSNIKITSSGLILLVIKYRLTSHAHIHEIILSAVVNQLFYILMAQNALSVAIVRFKAQFYEIVSILKEIKRYLAVK